MTTSWGKSSGKAFAKVLIFGHFLTWGFCWKLWKQLQANLCLGFVSTSIKNIQLFGSNERKDASKLELESAFEKNNCVKLRFLSFFFSLSFIYSQLLVTSLTLSLSHTHPSTLTHTATFLTLNYTLLSHSLNYLCLFLTFLPLSLSLCLWLKALKHTLFSL